MTRTDYDPDADGSSSSSEEARWGDEGAVEEAEPVAMLATGERNDMPVLPDKQSEIDIVIFRAVVGNEIEVLKDLSDSGASFNIYEPAAGNTPLHIACSIGMRAMAQFLVERGAKIDVKNLERKTPMHLLVERRWADLAKWLAYQKADLYAKDKFGKSPLDYAHPWLKGELTEISAQRERAETIAEGTLVVAAENEYGKQPQNINIKAGTGMTDEATLLAAAQLRSEKKVFNETVDVHLRNMKAREVTYGNTDTAQELLNKAAETFAMPEIKAHLQLFVAKPGVKDAGGVQVAPEPVPMQQVISRIRSNEWPERDSFKFMMQPIQGCPYNMGMRYREIMYGTEAKLSQQSRVEVAGKKKKGSVLSEMKKKKAADKKKQASKPKKASKKKPEKKKRGKK